MTSARPASARTSALPLLGWLAVLGAAIVGLTLAGRGALAAPSVLDLAAWGSWASGRDAVTMVFAVLRLLTLALAWYLLGATIVGGLARLARWRRMVVVADLLTVPAVRRLLQSALGLGLATAALTVGSPASDHASASSPAATLTMTAQADSGQVVMTPLGDAGETMAPMAQIPVPAPDQQWTVEHGDHLWSIAERVLTRAWGRAPTDAETVDYWDRLIRVNADRLADPDNPDLIYPGQTFSVPQPPRKP